MGVDQGNGLHIVVKEPQPGGEVVHLVRAHHEPQTDSSFSHLDWFMRAFDVKTCIIDALPNTHAARAFARRFPGRVYLAYYLQYPKSLVEWGGADGTGTVNIGRTEAFDSWRDIYQKGKRQLPRIEGEVAEYVEQLTNILRSVREDPETGQKKARWIPRGADHYAHADCYAEIGLVGRRTARVYATVISSDDW
jgi:hypothetical protein